MNNGYEVSLGNLYDLNKAAMKNIEPISETEILTTINNLLTEYFQNRMELYQENGKYYMLLCREVNDYTIFLICPNYKATTEAVDSLLECLKNRGDILSIEEAPGDALEIWLRTNEDKEEKVYYLFPYDEGVIECIGDPNDE